MAAWILLAVFGNCLLAGASLFDKEVVKRISPCAFLVFSELIWVPVALGVALLSPWYPFLQKFFGAWLSLVVPAGRLWIIALAPGLCVSIAGLLYFFAMRQMAPSRVVVTGLVVSSCSSAVIGMALRGRFFAFFELAAFGLLLAGGLLASWYAYGAEPRDCALRARGGVPCIMLAGIGWGMHPALLDASEKNFPWLSVFFWQNVAGIMFALLICAFRFRATIRECADIFFRPANARGRSRSPLMRLVGYFSSAKALGFFGGYMLSFAIIAAPQANKAFIPAFGGVRYVAAFCYEQVRNGRGARECIGMLATLRTLVMLVAAGLIVSGIFILALHAS